MWVSSPKRFYKFLSNCFSAFIEAEVVVGYLFGWNCNIYMCALFMSKALNFLRLFSGCLAVSDEVFLINALKFCSSDKHCFFNLSKHYSHLLASQKPKRMASMLVAKFSVSPEKLIHFEMRDSYKIQKLKKETDISSFVSKKSLCAFQFRFLPVPVTSSTFTFATSY